MKIYAANNYSQYLKTNPQIKNADNISFGIIEQSAKKPMAQLGVGLFSRMRDEDFYASEEFTFYGDDGVLKCKVHPYKEHYERRKAEIDSLKKELQRSNGVVPTREALATLLEVLVAIFPPPFKDPHRIPSDANDHYFLL